MTVLISTLADEVSSAGVFGVWRLSSESGFHFRGFGKAAGQEQRVSGSAKE